jgi:hypothetical protein
MTSTKGTWIIDVCRTCHRVVRYPFCEHRPTGYQAHQRRWMAAVRVTGTLPKGMDE